MKYLSILITTLFLTACASHKPAKMPSGTPFPINKVQTTTKAKVVNIDTLKDNTDE